MGRLRLGMVGLLALVVALPAGAGSSFVPALAAGCNEGSKAIAEGHPLDLALNADNSWTVFVCPEPPTSPTAVLEFSATPLPDNAQDFSLCVDGVTHAHTAGKYVRSSHLKGSPIQRAGLLTPFRNDEYRVSLNACDQMETDPTGSFVLHVSYQAASPNSPSEGFQFATQHLPIAGGFSTPGSGEPSIAVDALHGNRVYISGPVGIPSGGGCVAEQSTTNCNGINFWFSESAGAPGSFVYCNPSQPNGGGDSHVALDTTGSIYGADLAATFVDTQKLASTAAGPPVPDASATGCGFQDTTPAAAASDRQWLATYLPDPSKGTDSAKVVLSYHDLAAQQVWECLSSPGGLAWEPACNPVITDGDIFVDSATNTINGNQVFDSAGRLFSIFGTATIASNLAGSGYIHNLYVGRSEDGGQTFTDHKVIETQAPHTPDAATSQDVANIFPTIGVDRADNLYAVWSQMLASGGPAAIYLAVSKDHGEHWSAPVRVSSPALLSNVLPWIAAGDDGRIDIVWVGSTDATKPNDVKGTWNIYMAQSLNADKPNATFATTVVNPQPVRFGWVCTQGILCTEAGDDGRVLLDFVNVAVDSNGMANIAYGDFGPDTSNLNNANHGFWPYTDYAKQIAGSSLNAPAPAHGNVLAQQVGLPFTAAPHPGLPLVPLALGLLGLMAVVAAGAGRRLRSRRSP